MVLIIIDSLAYSQKFNEILVRIFFHDDLELGKGKLIPLPKPNKTKGPVTNLRPITLLQIIRKILSKIEVSRTEKAIDQF